MISAGGDCEGNLLLLRPLFFYLGALQDSVNVWRLKRVLGGGEDLFFACAVDLALLNGGWEKE